MVQSIATSSGTLATSGNVTDTTVTVAQQHTSLTSSIPENIVTPTERESSQQIRMCLCMLCLYTSANIRMYVHSTYHNICMHICTGFTMCLILESHAKLYNYLYCICTAVMTAEDTKAALRTFE